MTKNEHIGLSLGNTQCTLLRIDIFDDDFSSRRYQDFYLLEQKLTEFHGVFSDARLPPRRSPATARNLEFLESMKKDFEHFLRVRHISLLLHFAVLFSSSAFIIQTHSSKQ